MGKGPIEWRMHSDCEMISDTFRAMVQLSYRHSPKEARQGKARRVTQPHLLQFRYYMYEILESTPSESINSKKLQHCITANV